jgi:SPP1 family predicted phage head-tail adaptor
MLTQSELTDFRAQQLAAMPGSAIIYRASLASDGMGGQTETWAAIGTVAARLYPTQGYSSNERLAGAQDTSMTRWWLSMPYDTDATAADVVKVDGRVFKIQEVNNDEMWRTALRCKVEAHNEETSI